MAKSTTGKWVSRVGSSGGGKAYRKSRPANYYGALIVIVVLGIAATLLARYDYVHPPSKPNGTPPAVGTTWYAALRLEACGKTLPNLTPDPSYQGGFKVGTDDVMQIKPVSAADSGSHATVAQFANEFPGLIVSSGELAVPTSTGTPSSKTTYHNGDTCPTGSKYAGQTGQVKFAYWTSFGQSKPTVTNNPASVKFRQYLRLTIAFEPAGVTPQPPSQATVNLMVQLGSTGTTTSVASVPTTTAPSSSTTAVTTTTGPKG